MQKVSSYPDDTSKLIHCPRSIRVGFIVPEPGFMIRIG